MLASYPGTLGELRSGGNNFSFKTYEDLDVSRLTSLIVESHRFLIPISDVAALPMAARNGCRPADAINQMVGNVSVTLALTVRGSFVSDRVKTVCVGRVFFT